MKIVLSRVTWYSRLLAVIFFIFGLPILTFYIGTQYEATKIAIEQYGTSIIVPNSSVSAIASQGFEHVTAPQQTISGIKGTIKGLNAETPVLVKNGTTIVTETMVPANGTFVIFVKPGSYSLVSSDGIFTTASVEVKANMMASIALQ